MLLFTANIKPQSLLQTNSAKLIEATFLFVLLKNIPLNKEFYNPMKEVTVQELKSKIDQGEDFQLIDVREQFEYEMSNLNGENIPLAGILIEAHKLSKDKPVIIQCRSGARSTAAILQLEKQFGMDNLYNLRGGILAWASEFDPEMQVY